MPRYTEKYKLSHIHDFMYKRFFVDCSQRQPTVPLSLRINTGSLYHNVSIIAIKRIKITSARYTEAAVQVSSQVK